MASNMTGRKTVTWHSGLTKQENALFWSLLNVGAMGGALLGGSLVEHLGRLRAVTVSCLPFTLAFFGLCVFPAGSYTAYMLLGSRVLAGVGIGLATVSVPLYISETAPTHLRGGLGCLFQLGGVVGLLYVYAVGVVITDYRGLALAGAFLPCFVLVATMLLPQSPRWLLSKHRHAKAARALQTVRGTTADGVDAEMMGLRAALKSTEQQASVGLGDLFKGSTGSAMKIAAFLLVFQQFSSINAVVFHATEMFKSAGVSDASTGSLILAIAQLVVTALSCVIIDKVGRRPLLMTAGTGMCAALVVLGFHFHVQH